MNDLLIRKATMRDIRAALDLINGYASGGIMLPRTEFEMAENIRDFTVLTEGSRILACGALHFYTPSTAEVRSLAVDPGTKGHGLGRRIVEALDREAEEHGLSTVFAFTYVPEFFRKLGYERTERDALPLKTWKDCLRCPKFQACDEIAMVKKFRTGEHGAKVAPARGLENPFFEILTS